MTTETTTPKVWIGCLAAYNAGHLHGEWVDAAVDEDEIWEAQRRVLASSPVPGAEEHFIADHEGFAPFRVGEYDSLTNVAKIARLIDEHGVAFAAWLANGSYDAEDADEGVLEESFREEYRGEFDSEEEYVRDLVSEVGLPSVGYVAPLRSDYGYQGRNEQNPWQETLDQLDVYLDWGTITRAMMEDGWTYEDGGKVHVFVSA